MHFIWKKKVIDLAFFLTIFQFNCSNKMENDNILQTQIQPQFPPPYSNDNVQAIDWGLNHLVAYASGSCLHLSHHVNDKLEHVGSIEVTPFHITCAKFHPTLPIIAIGDVKGRIFIWDLESSTFIATAKPLKKFADKCLSMEWHDGVLLVLLHPRKLVAVTNRNGCNTETLKNLKILWEISLPNDYIRISIDPYFQNSYLLHGNQSFSLFQSEFASEPPKQIINDVTFSSSIEIRDLQWSIHFTNFLYVLSKNSIFLFNIETSTIASVVEDNPDSFSFLVQFPTDHTKLITLNCGGGITVYQMSKHMTCRTIFTTLPKMTSGIFASVAISPYRDNYLALFHSIFGLALFDIETMKLNSMDFTFPSKITSFDSDSTRYVTGTNEGYVIIGNLFDSCEIKRFKVSDYSVEFVSYDAPLFRVYWQTVKDLGIIDIPSRTITVFHNHSTNFVRSFGSHRGGFIVMHDQNIIGVFVEGKEKRLVFDDAIADIYIDPESTQTSGSFSILLTRHTILFYKYDAAKIYSDSQGIAPRGIQVKAVCYAQNSDNTEYVTGFANGMLFFYCPLNQQVKRIGLECLNLRSLQFGADNNTLFGMCKEESLFVINRVDITPNNSNNKKKIGGLLSKVIGDKDTIRYCDFGVRAYKVINESLLLVHANDGIIKFVRISDWCPLSLISKYMPPPTSDMQLVYFIQHQKEEIFFSQSAKDAWLCAKNEYPMRLHSMYGIHRPTKVSITKSIPQESELYVYDPQDLAYDTPFDEILFAFNSRFDDPSDDIIRSQINSLLFLNKFDEASDLVLERSLSQSNNAPVEPHLKSKNVLHSDESKKSPFLSDADANNQMGRSFGYFNSAIFSTLILLSESELSERARIHMKSSAISLISHGQYDDAASFLRLAKFDKEGAEYLIDSSQLSLATKFIRNTVAEEDKSLLLFKCGCKYFEIGKLDNAIAYFAGAGQYHAVLFVLFSKGNVADAYFLMKYLQEQNKLMPVDEKMIKFFPDLHNLDEICEMIISQFNVLLKKLNLSL